MLPPTGYCIGPDTAHHHMRKSLQNVSRLRCCNLPNPHADHCMGALRLPTLLLDSLSYYFLPNPSAWLWDMSTTLIPTGIFDNSLEAVASKIEQRAL